MFWTLIQFWKAVLPRASALRRKAIPTTPPVPAPLGLEPNIDNNHQHAAIPREVPPPTGPTTPAATNGPDRYHWDSNPGPREASNAHNLSNGAARKAIPTTPPVPAPLGLEPNIANNHQHCLPRN